MPPTFEVVGASAPETGSLAQKEPSVNTGEGTDEWAHGLAQTSGIPAAPGGFLQ